MTGSIKQELNKEEASDIFAKGGVLGPDQGPKVWGLSEEAHVKFFAALEKGTSGATVIKSEAAKLRKDELDKIKKLEEEAKVKNIKKTKNSKAKKTQHKKKQRKRGESEAGSGGQEGSNCG